MLILTANNKIKSATPAKASVAKNARVTTRASDNAADASVRRVYLGIDLHKHAAVTCTRLDNAPPQPAQRIVTGDFVEWMQKQKVRYPRATFFFCYEAGPCGYWLYRDLIEKSTGYVVAPEALNGRRKTDARDATALCRNLHDYVNGHHKAFGVVSVPSREREAQRGLVRYRKSVQSDLQALHKRCKSWTLLHGKDLKNKWWRGERWKENVPDGLSETLCWQIESTREQILVAEKELAKTDAKLAEMQKQNCATMPLPKGLGALTWLTLCLEIGDWHRFANRRQIASYTGLCPGEHTSGNNRVELSIDKRGNKIVRTILIEAAWRIYRYQPNYPPVAKFFGEAKGSRNRRRAIVAVARRLAIDLWRIATGQSTPEKLGLQIQEN